MLVMQTADDGLTNLSWLVQPSAFNAFNCCSAPPPLSPPPPAGTSQTQATTAGLQRPTPLPAATTLTTTTAVDYKTDAVKPPYSYAQLIAMAMEAHGNCKVLLTHIYSWIRDNFAYFRNNDTTWQNSVRHNLSLNKQFIKVPRDSRDKGKGSYWMLDPKMKNQYCLRRRNFGDFTSRRCPYPDVIRPQVNPAVKVFLESTRQRTPLVKEEVTTVDHGCKVQLLDNTVEDIGAQESVYAGSESAANLYDFNERLFKKEVEEYDTSYRPLVSEMYDTDEPKVKVEFNWEAYECGQENRTSSPPALPLDQEEVASLDVRIPTPEWWGNISTASNLLMSPCGLGATRSLENLVNGTGVGAGVGGASVYPSPQQLQRKEDHSWSEGFPSFALDGDGLLLDFDPSRSDTLLMDTRRFQDCTLFE